MEVLLSSETVKMRAKIRYVQGKSCWHLRGILLVSKDHIYISFRRKTNLDRKMEAKNANTIKCI